MALATIISTIVRAIGMIIPPIGKYFNQPKLYVTVKFKMASKRTDGLSGKNKLTEPIPVGEAIYLNRLTWEYDFIIRNNSEHVAYNIKLTSPQVSANFAVVPIIDSLLPLLANGEVSYEIKFFKFFEGKSAVANEISRNPPEQFKSDKFILEYTNSKDVKFYTVYDYYAVNDKNQLYRKFPK